MPYQEHSKNYVDKLSIKFEFFYLEITVLLNKICFDPKAKNI